MGVTATPAYFLDRRRQLEAEAREHKTQAGHHRRKLRDVMTALARLDAECQRLGIRVTVERSETP
jgi:hypothetical protein